MDAECSIKDGIFNEISKFTPPQGKDSPMIGLFKKLVETDQKIVRSLNVHVSYINGNILSKLTSLYKDKILPEDSYEAIRPHLLNYLRCLEGFNYSNLLWHRTFLGNPFETILNKLNSGRSASLNSKIFLNAYQTVANAQNKISTIMSDFKQNLEDQLAISKQFVTELDYMILDYNSCVNAASLTEQIHKLVSVSKMVSDSVGTPEKPTKLSQNPWRAQLITQLDTIESAHRILSDAIGPL